MARSTGWQLPETAIRRKFYGIAAFNTWRGLLIVKKWPRKRGKRGTPAQMAARAEFTKMVRAVQAMIVEDQVAAHDLATGTAFTWRDVLSSAMTMNLVDVEIPLDFTAQAALDTIIATPGAILLRGATKWVGLAPQGAGQVLTMVAGFPDWEPLPVPPPGPGGWSLLTLDSAPTTVFGSVRTFLTPLSPGTNGAVYDVFAIAQRTATTSEVGIVITNPALNAGYQAVMQNDGNIVLYRWVGTTRTALRAAGIGLNPSQISYQILRLQIACQAGKNNIIFSSLPSFTDNSTPDFSTTGLRFGIHAGGTSVAVKIGVTPFSTL